MLNLWLKFVFIFLGSFLFFACNFQSIPEQSPLFVRNESLPRIIALTSLTADITQRLAPDSLVGFSGTSLHLSDERFKDVQRVSQGFNPPNLEKILALKPDLVIVAEGLFPQVISQIEQLGIKTLNGKVDSWERLLLVTKTLGEILNVDPSSLLNEYKTCTQNIPQSRKSTVILVSTKPLLSPTKKSWAGNLIERLNIDNITSSIQADSNIFGGYVTISPEIIIQNNPEIILLVNGQEDTFNNFKNASFWKELNAVKNNRIYSLDNYGLINPGSVDKIKNACSELKQIFK